MGSALSLAVLEALTATVFLEAPLPPCFLRRRGAVVKDFVCEWMGDGGRWRGRVLARHVEHGPVQRRMDGGLKGWRERVSLRVEKIEELNERLDINGIGGELGELSVERGVRSR